MKLVVAAARRPAALPQRPGGAPRARGRRDHAEAHAAVLTTRNRRVGLMATQATVDAGRYADLIHTLDAGVRFFGVACPRSYR